MQPVSEHLLKSIVCSWIDSYDGKLPKDSKEKASALNELLDVLVKYGFDVAEIKSAKVTRIIMQVCCPPVLKDKVKDYNTWYRLTERLWSRVVGSFEFKKFEEAINKHFEERVGKGLGK